MGNFHFESELCQFLAALFQVSLLKSTCSMQTPGSCCSLLAMKTTAKTFLGNTQLPDGHGLISQPLYLGPYLLVPKFSP